MNKKSTLTVKSFIDSSIKVNDTVYLIDGSALSCINYPNKDFYIVNSYDELGVSETLKLLPLVVTEINITDKIIFGSLNHSVYLQDIIVEHKKSGVKFRTCSKFTMTSITNNRSIGNILLDHLL